MARREQIREAEFLNDLREEEKKIKELNHHQQIL